MSPKAAEARKRSRRSPKRREKPKPIRLRPGETLKSTARKRSIVLIVKEGDADLLSVSK